MNVRVYIICIIHTTYTYIIKVHNRESNSLNIVLKTIDGLFKGYGFIKS